mmetsp:Transcript_3148/g.4635  ORF Transcript_3148/g.4635 Transcript_3148/m.4635 type:complete len:140 (-) Transcript_3148:26-445(-)
MIAADGSSGEVVLSQNWSEYLCDESCFHQSKTSEIQIGDVQYSIRSIAGNILVLNPPFQGTMFFPQKVVVQARLEIKDYSPFQEFPVQASKKSVHYSRQGHSLCQMKTGVDFEKASFVSHPYLNCFIAGASNENKVDIV